MSDDLYDATIASFSQALTGLSGTMKTARDHFDSRGVDLQTIVEARLHPTMKPFRFQIRSVFHHSVNAVAGIRKGSFSPPASATDDDWQALEALVEQARTEIDAVAPDELKRLASSDVVFSAPGRERTFSGRLFLLSFSIPNFYFHVTTAYDILRAQDAPLQKRDYLGPVRSKPVG